MKRWLFFLFSLIATIALIAVLGTRRLLPVPLGKLLSPQEGIWQNAEPVTADFSQNLNLQGLQKPVQVYFDERLVPHVFAQNEADAFMVQGYLHARFRLWQMDFQARAGAGRLSEVLGAGPGGAILQYDRSMRRLGMVFAAERAVESASKDSAAKLAFESYARGVNAYIEGLTEARLPIEYKLLGYFPEKWTNLHSAIFLKYMCFDLAGGENDFELTNAKNFFNRADFESIYPILQDSLDPIFPRGTPLDSPRLNLVIPQTADSLYFGWGPDSIGFEEIQPDKNNGSNNWALSGLKTKSGRPILCNDPHLGLNLPSLWYEMQIHTPKSNAYGVTFPGAPAIIIGFNDSCAWGFTNAGRDVRDYYSVRFRDKSRKEYFYNGGWKETQWRIENILVKGHAPFKDSVAYTVMGPVMYDPNFSGNGRSTEGKNYAVRWKAHDPSNELKMFILLNRASNYQDYLTALKEWKTPGQNCIFASKSGDIALWSQGEFPAKWRRQGDFIMPGEDSSYLWQGMIPPEENPHLLNPERGFVSSANQLPLDSGYAYYLGGSFPVYRGRLINRRLTAMNQATPEDMKKLQTDNYNLFAEMARPVLLNHLNQSALNSSQKKYLSVFREWNLRNDPGEKGPAIFENWWDSLETAIWKDELSQTSLPVKWPERSTLLEALIRDTAFRFIDNIHTEIKENLTAIVTGAYKKAADYFDRVEVNESLAWGDYKHTAIRHLLRQEALGLYDLKAGGGTEIINAIEEFHGPSWRMIVELTDITEAYGIYPGGQSGNPGSRFYDDFTNNWVKGDYYRLWVMKENEKQSPAAKWSINFDPR